MDKKLDYLILLNFVPSQRHINEQFSVSGHKVDFYSPLNHPISLEKNAREKQNYSK